MAELADAQVSEACGRKAVGVQLPLSALNYFNLVRHRHGIMKTVYADRTGSWRELAVSNVTDVTFVQAGGYRSRFLAEEPIPPRYKYSPHTFLSLNKNLADYLYDWKIRKRKF